MTLKTKNTLSLALCALLLAACGGESGGTSGIDEVTSRRLAPADEELKGIYNRSCRSCHTVRATGSPLTGDSAAWAERMQKGMDVLVDNVVDGYGGMPPFGLCMDCNADQFEALIEFMAEAP